MTYAIPKVILIKPPIHGHFQESTNTTMPINSSIQLNIARNAADKINNILGTHSRKRSKLLIIIFIILLVGCR